MAQEDLGQTRTEEATPRKREEAREQGQVAFSADLTTGLLLLLSMAALAFVVPTLTRGLIACCRGDLAACAVESLEPLQVRDMFRTLFARGLEWIGLFLAVIVVAGVLVPVFQVGFYVAPGLVGLNMERLSMSTGWSRLVSLEGGIKGLIALAKIAAIGLAAYFVLKWRGLEVAAVGEMRLASAAARAWSTILHLSFAVAGTLVLLGLVDYFWQRWRHDQSLRMTRQELKDEIKRDEGDPMVKARIRKLQRDAAHGRMMQDVPSATVVITNPTHLAIALRYAPQEMGAPRVLAKAAGAAAHRIVEIARRHGVSVVEKRPLAQALFKVARVGQEIPAALYVAVAEVLAFVFRLRGMARAG